MREFKILRFVDVFVAKLCTNMYLLCGHWVIVATVRGMDLPCTVVVRVMLQCVVIFVMNS